ncbi:MAG: PAS domain S-box protein [Acidobacteria bacterium]|nr:PAS domain S-box protein [Acidobacteriota bacterium]
MSSSTIGEQGKSANRTAAAGTTLVRAVLSGGGEMGALMRAFNWETTPLGPLSQWPQSLRIAVRILLGTGYPMLLCWGRPYTMLYNDGYRPILGRTKHPGALGSPIARVFPEAMDFIGPRFEQVMARGEDFTVTDQLFILDRNDYFEECYFTFSYSPAPADDGSVGGVLVTALETTERVLDDRRRRTLRDLAMEMARTHSEQEVWHAAASSLTAEPRIVPFAALYSYDASERRAALAACAGGTEEAMCPASVELEADNTWPLGSLARGENELVVGDLCARFPNLPPTSWGVPPEKAVIVPIRLREGSDPAGYLIAGLSPRREFDDAYRQFFVRSAEQIATALTAARAYEHERRRAEALAEIDRAKTVFFSNVSHEFRTPLTLMLGPLEELISRPGSRFGPEEQEQLQIALRNARRLLKLVNTLLDFSRIEAGRAQANYQATDLSGLTKEIASVFRSTMAKAGLRFAVECEPLSQPVFVDPEMWEKIVLNLLSNAFKFTFEGSVTLTLKETGGSVELAVRDTGVGIPEQEQPRVFERFHRIENVRSRSYEGTGIGLSLVHELVKLHGGKVTLQSASGRGSTFTVTIPRGSAHLPPERLHSGESREPAGRQALASGALSAASFVDELQRWLPDEAGAEPGPLAYAGMDASDSPVSGAAAADDLIVVADDNADMRGYVARLLRSHFQVRAVADGQQALDAIRELRPSLVLADVMMPGLDGFGVLRAIRHDASLRSIPVILVSARAGEESCVQGLEAGADDYLFKPFTARELVARVAAHVKLARLRREAAEREARLHAEAELERSRLHDLLAQAPAAIGVMFGAEHRWSFVNDHYVRVTGRSSAGDFLGKTVQESLPEMETQPFIELLDEVYRTGKPYCGSEMKAVLNRGAEGQPEAAYFDFVYQPLRNANGDVEGILVHAVEVTDKVLARKSAEENAERLRLAYSAGQIGAWEWDPVKQTRRLSDELQKMFAIDENDPDSAQAWASRVYPDDLPGVLQKMEEANRAGELEFEYRYVPRQGELRWFYCKGRRVPGETRMFGVVQDITARKHAEEAQRRLAAIVESSDDAIISKDLNGVVTSWNPAAQRIFGYTAAEMIGRSIRTVIPPELQNDEEMILQTIAQGERIDHFETTRMTKGGERIDVSLTISPVKDASGRIIGAAKIARDITQQKKSEHALRIAERLASVGRLAATVAHEINNPLEAVTNLVYLARTHSTRQEVRGYLSQVEDELERISHITKQTLGFYRETRHASTVQVSTLLPALVAVFATRARSRGIEIRFEAQRDHEICAVPGEIRQLIANLLSNSMDALESGGVIRVRTSPWRSGWRGAAGVRITVADTGPGIPPELRSRVFEPFFTTKRDVGTGLGLWVCKNIVDRHGGSIRVKSSVKPGNTWTVFSVFLPSARQQQPGEALKQAV